MKKILITGGAGFIGSHLANELIKRGYTVRGLDNLSEQVHGKNAKIPAELDERVEFILGDVRNTEDWRKALSGMDVVVHLAAETGTGQSMYEVYHYTDTNIGGTAKLIDILTNEKHSIKKVLVASSRAIYGEGAYNCLKHGIVYPEFRTEEDLEAKDFGMKCPICGESVSVVATKEDALLHPVSVYGITKQVQEELVLTLCKNLGIPALAYRFQNVYGPGQSLSNPYTGILSIFSTRIRQGKDINIFEDGQESRDFVYIDDIVAALIAGIESDRYMHESFNVGTGKMVTVETVVNELMRCYKKTVPVHISGMFRVGDIRNNYADMTKTEKLLGFRTKVDFSEGIEKFADWVCGQDMNLDGYERSLNELKERGLLK